jgi:hypothetical protein
MYCGRTSDRLQRGPIVFATSQYRFVSGGAPKGGDDDEGISGRPGTTPREDLPYKVELWDAAKQAVEQTLAVTASATIGFAAYHAATREYPERYITLRHKNSIVSRWNSPSH